MTEYDWEHPDPSEVARWAEAVTLENLSTLTASWIRGEFSHHPMYGDSGLAKDSSGIADALAEMNDLRLVTEDSQPGIPMDEHGSAQRAYLEAFCDEATAAAVCRVLRDTELVVIHFSPGSVGEGSIVVTTDGDEEFTWLGRNYPEDRIQKWSEWVSPVLGDLVATTWTLQVIDPVWGRNDRLWPAVLIALKAARGVTE